MTFSKCTSPSIVASIKIFVRRYVENSTIQYVRSDSSNVLIGISDNQIGSFEIILNFPNVSPTVIF